MGFRDITLQMPSKTSNPHIKAHLCAPFHFLCVCHPTWASHICCGAHPGVIFAGHLGQSSTRCKVPGRSSARSSHLPIEDSPLSPPSSSVSIIFIMVTTAMMNPQYGKLSKNTYQWGVPDISGLSVVPHCHHEHEEMLMIIRVIIFITIIDHQFVRCKFISHFNHYEPLPVSSIITQYEPVPTSINHYEFWPFVTINDHSKPLLNTNDPSQPSLTIPNHCWIPLTILNDYWPLTIGKFLHSSPHGHNSAGSTAGTASPRIGPLQLSAPYGSRPAAMAACEAQSWWCQETIGFSRGYHH